jgi:hypothetical protein
MRGTGAFAVQEHYGAAFLSLVDLLATMSRMGSHAERVI